MNGKVTDAAVEAACQWGLPEGVIWRDLYSTDEQAEAFKNMRAAIEAALPHLQPAKPEAVRLRDELRERAEFEAWAATGRLDLIKRGEDYVFSTTEVAWIAWRAALDATGKQQVGEVPDGMVMIQISDAKALCAYVTHSPRSALAARRVAELIGERNMRMGDA